MSESSFLRNGIQLLGYNHLNGVRKNTEGSDEDEDDYEAITRSRTLKYLVETEEEHDYEFLTRNLKVTEDSDECALVSLTRGNAEEAFTAVTSIENFCPLIPEEELDTYLIHNGWKLSIHDLINMLTICRQCEPSISFATAKDGLAHALSIHEKAYCPACFHLVPAVADNPECLIKHMETCHIKFTNGLKTIFCPFCLNLFEICELYDHLKVKHLIPTENDDLKAMKALLRNRKNWTPPQFKVLFDNPPLSDLEKSERSNSSMRSKDEPNTDMPYAPVKTSSLHKRCINKRHVASNLGFDGSPVTRRRGRPRKYPRKENTVLYNPATVDSDSKSVVASISTVVDEKQLLKVGESSISATAFLESRSLEICGPITVYNTAATKKLNIIGDSVVAKPKVASNPQVMQPTEDTNNDGPGSNHLNNNLKEAVLGDKKHRYMYPVVRVTQPQLEVLLQFFSFKRVPNKKDRHMLNKKIGLPIRDIQRWFIIQQTNRNVNVHQHQIKQKVKWKIIATADDRRTANVPSPDSNKNTVKPCSKISRTVEEPKSPPRKRREISRNSQVILRLSFAKNPYPDNGELERLSKELKGQVSVRRIKSWFLSQRRCPVKSVTKSASGADLATPHPVNCNGKNPLADHTYCKYLPANHVSTVDGPVVTSSIVACPSKSHESDLDHKGTLALEEISKTLTQCRLCTPLQRFSNAIQASGHLQTYHGLRFCPVCFRLISCAGSFLQDHMEITGHFISDKNEVNCPICNKRLHFLTLLVHLDTNHILPQLPTGK